MINAISSNQELKGPWYIIDYMPHFKKYSNVMFKKTVAFKQNMVLPVCNPDHKVAVSTFNVLVSVFDCMGLYQHILMAK